MKFYIALWFAKVLGVVINLVSKDRGTNLPGEKALKIDANFVKNFKNFDYSKVVFITGTNGKSSTTNLLTHLLKENGKKIISNLEGANLLGGIATVLAKESSLFGKLKADYFIFETDERYLPLIYAQLPAKNMLITNLQKDQVQRNGDPDFIYRKLGSFINGDMRLFLNNEEPRSRSFEDVSDQCFYFGVEKHEESFKKDETYPTLPCPKCNHDILFDYYNTDSVGPFSCVHCGYKSDEKPQYLVEKIDFNKKTFSFKGTTIKMPYDLPFMFYNYAGALAVAKELCGINSSEVAASFNNFKNIGGRFEILKYKNKTIKYMRIKQENPDTLQSALNVMASDKSEKMVALGLYPVEDFTPFYTNTFYAFDCDFKPLVNSKVEKYFCFSEHVAYDTANRLIYEGVNPEEISIMNSDNLTEIFSEIDKAKTDNIYLITKLATFESMKKYIEGGVEHE
ncbi:MAG: MurT ligase domain-containing protein [Eubacteriaceae bacterium]